MSRPCRYCRGAGYLSVEPGSSLTYACPDCNDEREDDEQEDEEQE